MNQIIKKRDYLAANSCMLRYLIISTFIIALLAPSYLLAQPNGHLQVKIESGTVHNYLVLGVDSTATDGFDNLWETPALFGGGIMAYFPHDDWNRAQNKFWRDIKSNDSGTTKTWPFIVDIDPDSSLLNSEFRISWNVSKIPQDYSVTLIDDTTAQQIDMRANPSHSFIFTTPRTYKVVIEIP